jgi:hypothetical protein
MAMDREGLERVRSPIESPAPAKLTTYRRDGSAHVCPVWFRWTGDAFNSARPGLSDPRK